MQTVASNRSCTCIHQAPSTRDTDQRNAVEPGMTFHQYLAPLLMDMLYPSNTPNIGLTNLLPSMSYSPYRSSFGSLNGVNNSSLSLMPLLWGTGKGINVYTQPYTGYRGLSLLSPLQQDSRLNLRL